MNFDDIVVKESPGICRCCLSEGCYKDLGTEYTWMNETEVYADMLLDCFDIGITQHNDGPNGSKRLICEVCITRLRDACNFKKQVLDSEKRFIDMLGRGDFRPKVLMYQPQSRLKEESLEESAEDVLNADIEYLEDMDFGADDEEIKTEAHVSLPSTSEASHSRPKRGRPKKEEDRPEKVKKQKVAKGEEDTEPPELLIEQRNVSDESHILKTSKQKYLATYENFMAWKYTRNIQSLNEQVFLSYFQELAGKYKPSSLTCIYSMLRKVVLAKHDIEMKTYSHLLAFIRKSSYGYTGRKPQVLSSQDVAKFLKEAPDDRYLATKVALIFGIAGGCRRHELPSISTNNVERHGEYVLVKINNSKTTRTFRIHSPFYEIVQKYMALRMKNANTDRFFQNFQNGRCTAQPIGINKFGGMPKEIARYLGLPNADAYTGHSFRRTAAILMSSSLGVDCIKHNDGWRSDTDEEVLP